MIFIIFTIFLLLNVLIATYDFSFYRIPNLFVATLLVLYAFYAPLYLDLQTILSSLLVFAVVFAVCFCLYLFKVFAAGDAKYIAVASLWFGAHGAIPLLLFVSLAGGGLALLYLAFGDHVGRLSDLVWMKIQAAEVRFPKLQSVWLGSGAGPEMGKRDNIGSRVIPYGVAVAVGTIIMLTSHPITH